MPERALQMRAIGGRRVFRLKSWLPGHAQDGKPASLGGQPLPGQVGATLQSEARVLCLGPGEWLIVSPASAPEVSEEGLVLVELTDGLTALEVSGAAARAVLSKGCGLDMHPRSFPPGRCARTRFAQIPVVIECVDAPPRFELHVARSYHHYLHSWLTDAALEFGDSQP